MGKERNKKEKIFPDIRSRTTKHSLTIKSLIKIKDGLVIESSEGRRSQNHTPIKMEIIISRNDLERLFWLIMSCPSYFIAGFQEEFINPALLYIQKGARGRSKGKETTLFWLKAESRELYHLFRFIIDTGKTPSYFKKLLRIIDGLEIKKLFKLKSGKLDPTALAAYCIEWYMKNAGKNVEHLGIKSFNDRIKNSDLEGFYTHQIMEYKPLFNYTQDITVKDLENLIERPPFSNIFKLLGL